MDEIELKQRTKQFGLPVMKLVNALPNNSVGRAIGAQLIRSGTSVGANYRAACRGRSKPEFIAKLGIVIEEADESGYWMELIIEGELIPVNKVESLLDEANQLTAIMVASKISAKKRLTESKQEPELQSSNLTKANPSTVPLNHQSKIKNQKC